MWYFPVMGGVQRRYGGGGEGGAGLHVSKERCLGMKKERGGADTPPHTMRFLKLFFLIVLVMNK